MKIHLVSGRRRLKVIVPFSGSDHAVVEGKCQHCGVEPFKIAGRGQHIAADDLAYEATGYCLVCMKMVGTIRAEPETIFGVHEDEAVLYGRCRVY